MLCYRPGFSLVMTLSSLPQECTLGGGPRSPYFAEKEEESSTFLGEL